MKLLRPTLTAAAPVALSGISLSALAHPGHAAHAAEAFHWHASDLFGLAIVIGLGLGALWLARR